MKVVKDRDGGVVRRARLLDEEGRPVLIVCRFLDYLADRGMSPNTICAYAYDLKHLCTFLARENKPWQEFRPATALEFLAICGACQVVTRPSGMG